MPASTCPRLSGGSPAAFLWTLNGEIPKGPLKKMLPVFVGILLEILDQHNLVAGSLYTNSSTICL